MDFLSGEQKLDSSNDIDLRSFDEKGGPKEASCVTLLLRHQRRTPGTSETVGRGSHLR